MLQRQAAIIVYKRRGNGKKGEKWGIGGIRGVMGGGAGGCVTLFNDGEAF